MGLNKYNEKCEICGRIGNRIYHLHGYILCSKHMHQLMDYGYFRDNIPRTNNDLNDYVIEGDVVRFNLYNQRNEKIDEFIIDIEDLDKVAGKKWRKSHGHVLTGLPAQKTQRDITHIILGVSPNGVSDFVVDHKDGNGLNNRRSNLRICTQSENTINKSFMSTNTSGFVGISYREDREVYDSEIRIHGKRSHLGYTHTLEEAVYKRLIAEELVYGEFANETDHQKKIDFTKDLPSETKEKLKEITVQKLKSKGLIESI